MTRTFSRITLGIQRSQNLCRGFHGCRFLPVAGRPVSALTVSCSCTKFSRPCSGSPSNFGASDAVGAPEL